MGSNGIGVNSSCFRTLALPTYFTGKAQKAQPADTSSDSSSTR